MINDQGDESHHELAKFGRRPAPPRVCVVEYNTQVRGFLAEALDELGFIAREAEPTSIESMLRDFRPNLIVLGPLDGGLEARSLLRTFQAQNYGGAVMLFGGRGSVTLGRSQEIGEQSGLEMLPPLGAPLRHRDLIANLTRFLPVRHSPPLPVDLDEALRNGWLELWYQSKVDAKSLAPRGAEALVRVRHPIWGIVPPAYFIPGANDPYLEALSRFVITQALGDCAQFAAANHAVRIALPLPLLALEDMQFVDRTMERLPEKVRQNGFLVKIDCVDLIADFELVRRVAGQLASRNVGISISDIDTEGAKLASGRDLPIVEMKVSRKFIRGCADDRIKLAHCAQIVDLAQNSGAKSVAAGVETQPDFLTVRDLGFDLLQGHKFAKPMAPRKFEHVILARGHAAVA